MDNSALVSVIVPVYKVEDYLDRCVESVLRQSYASFELLLVDDGSPDRCGALCDAWAEKDARIRALHKDDVLAPLAAGKMTDEIGDIIRVEATSIIAGML